MAAYYDNRWDVIERFCRFLIDNPQWVSGRRVLVPGAGVGLETVVIGSLCGQLYINDIAPTAPELCGMQLHRNGVHAFEVVPGSYETIPLPPVDLIAGCYLVYDSHTADAVARLLARAPAPVLLMNDNMEVFQRLVRAAPRPARPLLPPDELPCLLFQ